ncbi:MAG: DUF1403 family protein [Methylocystis sp.]
MLEFDSNAPPDPDDVSAPERRVPRRAISAAAKSARKSREILSFPRWARPPHGQAGETETAFCAGASLAHLDRVFRCGEDGVEPVFSGALRQRLALRAAASCARLARLREDEGALRDAEHLSAAGAPPSPAGRPHRLFRLLSTRPLRLDAETVGLAAELLELRSAGATLAGLGAALQEILARAGSPLLAAAGVSRAAMTVLSEAAPLQAEILALWLADLALARRLGWEGPVPLLATVIAQPAVRGRDGRRPRPGDPAWENAIARAYALAAQEAHWTAVDLSRRAETLIAVAPKLRAKGADRVVALLLTEDCVSSARAAKLARLSDRASRRLFDRLIAQGAVRELSGRPNFRLYGL